MVVTLLENCCLAFLCAANINTSVDDMVCFPDSRGLLSIIQLPVISVLIILFLYSKGCYSRYVYSYNNFTNYCNQRHLLVPYISTPLSERHCCSSRHKI